MDVSIVSGTFNRLRSLQRMVNTIRNSFTLKTYGLNYEIVLVDGGSQDGTIEWCQKQADINLITHGELRGAVKAFNDGAFNSKGQYVILANDDIEFVGNSIWIAYCFMQSNPNCGMGCFYQDRNNKDWHIEYMPVNINNQQAHAPYGQVCIVPRWLGDYVGWWGDYLHTYGGDNELSSRIYELGFKVSPIEGAKIHDREVNDQLRKINNIQGGKDPRAIRGHHPDSWKWGKRWRNESIGVVGPVIKDHPQIENLFIEKHRILYLPIYEVGWEVQKVQKRGLRESLAKKSIVYEFDYVGETESFDKNRMMQKLNRIISTFLPSIILTQIHNDSIINAGDIRRLKNLSGALMVNWNGDYWPENLLSRGGVQLAREFDLQTVINRDVLNKYKELGINAAYWQIGWEPDGIGHKPDTDDRWDIVFLANGYSQDRKSFVKKIRDLNVSFGLWGNGWPKGWSQGQSTYDFISACKSYQSGKISLGDSQWPNTGFVSNRLFNALAAGGAALAHQWFKDIEQLGLVDGENCIIWKTFEELKEKIYYYLQHEEERKNIADKGQNLALERHSFDSRVDELFNMLKIQEVPFDDLVWR